MNWLSPYKGFLQNPIHFGGCLHLLIITSLLFLLLFCFISLLQPKCKGNQIKSVYTMLLLKQFLHQHGFSPNHKHKVLSSIRFFLFYMSFLPYSSFYFLFVLSRVHQQCNINNFLILYKITNLYVVNHTITFLDFFHIIFQRIVALPTFQESGIVLNTLKLGNFFKGVLLSFRSGIFQKISFPFH